MSDCDVLLINPPYVRRYGGGVVPPIGLCYLAASLRRAGAIPTILDLAAAFPDYHLENTEGPIQVVQSFLESSVRKVPVLVGIGPLVTATLRPTHDIIKACRQAVTNQFII